MGICEGQDPSKGIQTFAWLFTALSPLRLRLKGNIAVEANIFNLETFYQLGYKAV
jgi:hypothetical protein